SLSAAPSSTTAIATRVNGLNITQFYSIGVAPTQAVSGLTGEYFAAGAQDNGTQYFANATAGINGSTQSQGGDGAYTLFDQGADKYYISNYVYNESINLRPLPTSTVNAKVIDSDNDANSGAFIAPMVLDSNLDILFSDYSTTADGFRIMRYGNLKGGGPTTKTILTNPLLTASPTAFAVSPYTTATTTLLVGTRLGKLLKVTSANNTTGTWVDITGSSFVGSVSDIEFGASENEIFVTMHNYNVVSIWYTKDGGATWLNKEGNFPDIPVKAILPNPLRNAGGFATEVIVGTELGVWYSNNFNTASPTWSQSYNGMSNVKVVDLDMRNDNMVYAATYGRGVFSGMFTSITLSSLDFSQSNNIKMYPNPATDLVNISISNYVGDLKVELFDINGRLVKTKSVDFSGNYALDLNGLNSGVYIVKLSGSELNYSEKIVIN
ncbi:T9SS type A sorting domain-containing protein, partial [Flavobacterium sp.]|uniref:T9SS type A sorting domain-containing protein n=1 Tax=Flavobacterium sp. TaxID=239 RepID=UPI000E8B9B23